MLVGKTNKVPALGVPMLDRRQRQKQRNKQMNKIFPIGKTAMKKTQLQRERGWWLWRECTIRRGPGKTSLRRWCISWVINDKLKQVEHPGSRVFWAEVAAKCSGPSRTSLVYLRNRKKAGVHGEDSEECWGKPKGGVTLSHSVLEVVFYSM